MAYSNKVIDHYNDPKNVGSFTKEEEGVGTGLVGAPAVSYTHLTLPTKA